MKYVDAGYIIALSTLFLYAVSLVVRRRRLEQAAAIADRDRLAAGSALTNGSGAPTAGGGSPTEDVR